MIERFGLKVIEFWKRISDLPNQFEVTSKSKNAEVLKVNEIIVRKEDVDSDYWDSIGNHLLVEDLLKFDLQDWDDLKTDLSNWTSQQLWIFAEMLISEGSRINAIDPMAIYGYIFTIVDDKEAADLRMNLVELDNGIAKPTELMLSIRHRVESLRANNTLIPDANYVRLLNLIDDLMKAL